ncbi:uncharacterized protein FMAN_06808 [Fusarium mangiferae]|uniref:Uncharacterized protein n=1 Tax=Fusarium mangiferae TaxID=192010 RepID=A0A1L7UE93_FUSMA|nr:uncharacterized protein FMAN_06808 [Fusarium mangiferae]CVL08759.1 uncharacterized protein FMAN_06808 [Fusarium mangiferae]
MSTVLSASGDSAATTSYNKTQTQGSMTIKPASATDLSAWMYLPVYGSIPGKSLDEITVDFTAQSANIKTVAVYDGSEKVVEEKELGKSEAFSVYVSSREISSTVDGVTVSIEVEFETVEAWLTLSSVSVAF